MCGRSTESVEWPVEWSYLCSCEYNTVDKWIGWIDQRSEITNVGGWISQCARWAPRPEAYRLWAVEIGRDATEYEEPLSAKMC